MTARAQVPDEGELQLGTVRLPIGRLLRSEYGTGEPVAWRTQAPVPEPGPVWSALSALYGQTGLVPVLEPVGWGDLEDSCRDTSAVADVDLVDAAAMLEHRWADSFPKPWQVGPDWDEEGRMVDELAAPFTSRYPGLAPAMDAVLDPDVLEAAVRSFPASRIVLVPADRPADVLPVLGWCPGNWDGAFPVPCPVGFAAVLRSWEDRFSARLFALRHDRPTCSSSARPTIWTLHCRSPQSIGCSATSPPDGSRCGRPLRRSSMPPSGTSGGIDSGTAGTRPNSGLRLFRNRELRAFCSAASERDGAPVSPQRSKIACS